MTLFPTKSLFILSLTLFCNALLSMAQPSWKEIKQDNNTYRTAMNAEFRDSIESPLLPEDRLFFKALDFYPIKKKYSVIALLKVTPEASPFEMPRSKGNTGTYRKYGEATFILNGQSITVCIYQYMKLMSDEKYANHLFFPFGDLTNAKTTYGSGRYIDLTIPEGDTLIIDFNKAYNPLCAYGNSKYSCPIPPKENQIPVEIPAGMRNFRHPK